MSKHWLVLGMAGVLALAACGTGNATPTPGGTAPSSPSTSGTPGNTGSAPPIESTGPTGSPATSGTPAAFDCGTASGDLRLGGWSAAGSTEANLLQTVLDKFQQTCPNISNVTFEPLAESYDSLMLNKLGTDNAPDVIYVNQSYAPDWIDLGVLEPLDSYISASSYDTTHFYPGYLAPFQRNGQTWGFPKDSSVLGMETNDDLLAAASQTIPTTTDELVTVAQALKDAALPELANGAPMCFSNEWQRAGAFVEAFGGGMVTDDGTAEAIDSEQSKAAIQWYLDQIHSGLAMTPTDLGVDWCGAALAQKLVAIAFEGNWIGGAMANDAPDVHYTVSPIPQNTEQATLSYTVAYSIASRSQNKEAAWVLLSWLTSQAGMQEWVNGGLVLPARDDVTVNDPILQTFAPYAAFSHPGEGVTPQWTRVSDAFKTALLTAAQSGTGTADDVIAATKPVVDEVLAAGPAPSPSSSP